MWELSDTDFLTHFNLSYPQSTSWTLQPLLREMLSAVIGSLLRRRSVPTTLRIVTPPLPVRGKSGNSFAPPRASAPTCTTCQATLFPFSCCSRTGTVPAQSLPALNPCDLAQWRTPSAIRHVAQAFAGVGTPDPRVTAHGALGFRLQTLLRSWQRADPPPTRVKPLPLVVLRRAHQHALATAPAHRSHATGDCLLMAYFFLLRPGEYSGTPRTSADDLFRIQDVGL